MKWSVHKRHACIALPLASLVVFALSSPALAEEGTSGTPAAPPPATNAKAQPDASLSLGPVERLPPSAYPEPRVRGIYGGSLWMTFHGLQWPYYPKTGIGVSGYVWEDLGFEQLNPGQPLDGSAGLSGSTKSNLFITQGRLLLRATPTWSDGKYFVQGQGELVASQLGSSSNVTSSGVVWSADDVWVKAGKWNLFDVQVGRFEAWEVYHFGMALDLYTRERTGAVDPASPVGIADIYGLTTMFYRQDSLGQGAIHLYPLDWLRFEVGAHYGIDVTDGEKKIGVRPVGVVDLGWLKLKAGAEIQDGTGQAEGSKQETLQEGVGGGVQVIVDPYVEFGINGAWQQQDTRRQIDGAIDGQNSFHTYSIGGFANARVVEDLLVGAGVDYSFKEDTNFDQNLKRNDFFDQWQTFGAVQYALFHQLFIKAIFAYALANDHPIPGVDSVFRNEMFSGRLRLLYLF
jgi:hypothetical protein